MAAGIVRLGRAAVMEAEWLMAAFQRATDVVGTLSGSWDSQLQDKTALLPSSLFELYTPTIIITHKKFGVFRRFCETI